MSATFHDLQQLGNPLNGARLDNVTAIAEVFRCHRERAPFFFELHGDDGYMLTIGLAANSATVQYGRSDGSPPYLLAVAHEAVEDGTFMEFLAGNTPTSVSRRFCLPVGEVEKIASEFVTQVGKPAVTTWEAI